MTGHARYGVDHDALTRLLALLRANGVRSYRTDALELELDPVHPDPPKVVDVQRPELSPVSEQELQFFALAGGG